MHIIIVGHVPSLYVVTDGSISDGGGSQAAVGGTVTIILLLLIVIGVLVVILLLYVRYVRQQTVHYDDWSLGTVNYCSVLICETAQHSYVIMTPLLENL